MRSKNPTICKFMIQIGRYEELGSGVRKVNQYLPHYAPGAGKPIFDDGDMFTVTVPLGTGVGGTAGGDDEQVTPQVIDILRRAVSECVFSELQEAAGLRDRVHFLKAFMEPFLLAGWLERTIPDKPRSSKQKYRLTDAGRQILKQCENA